jgi:hypothetical protein
VESNQVYSAAEVERMMKLQDVLLKAMAKKICWWEAAEIIGLSDRTMRRWRSSSGLVRYISATALDNGGSQLTCYVADLL